ncbi:hypothetical protein [Mariprofundus ferrooxydans]|uniref:hypothetical protein n=1 Tax=Mariprofundus ferrooxydans TaxID=314344 RepID=UPI001E31B79F|nr:hypothetical protein [Mariprofundus ferrooxydans]
MSNRQNPLTDIQLEEVEEAFDRIVKHFTAPWLTQQSGNHMLQTLWNRRDALATNELFAFGKSLIASERISESWLRNQLKLIRGKDENNQRGAIFEILALGYLSSRQVVFPAAANHPGYDLDIKTKQGADYQISLKRYSQSTHEKLFRKKSAHAEKVLLDGLKKTCRNGMLYVEAKEHPSESDWQKLYSELNLLTSSFDGSKRIEEISGKWLIGLMPLIPQSNEQYSTGHISYSFTCSSPYHKNEQDNFTSKLEAAVSNLERHINKGSEQIPLIIIQLPLSASAITLTQWAQEYLNSNISSVLEAVLFVQPFTTSTEDMSSSYIAYNISSAFASSFGAKVTEPLNFEMPVGKITQQPPTWSLRSDLGDRPLFDKYVYQRGKHYLLASISENGSLMANVSRKAHGIETIAVINLSGKSFEVAGRWGEDLCLIGE